MLIFGKYSVLFFYTDIAMFYTQNAICVAVPFMAMGMYLRQNRKKLMQTVSVQKNIIYLCPSYFFALAERACLLHYYTAGMYIVHIWVLDIVEKVTNSIFIVYPFNMLICHTKFLIVFLLSLGIVILWKKIQAKTCKIL